MTDVGREALHAARQKVDPMEQRVFGIFSAADLVLFRGFLSSFIATFGRE